jgi:hypothetical protein
MRSPGAAFDLRIALTQELNAALKESDAVGDDGKAIHRCRVRLKRARALARVGRAVAPGLSEVFNETARAVMHTLAQARDLSAMADTARMLAETTDERHAQALRTTAEALDAARAQLPAIDLQSIQLGIKDLMALAQVWPASSPRQLRAGAKRLIVRARRARRRGRRANKASLRHEWRKREKDRLFAATLMNAAWPGKRLRKQTTALGHVLGLERDALLLLERLAAAPELAGGAAAAAQRVLRKHRKRLRRKANRLGARLRASGA